ncbi:MAG TPA: primosomal protein N' [Clostridia bacterium]|nr:primosomal protein N' [Clostridia bacterium]
MSLGIAKVAVENTAYHFDKLFDYIIDDNLKDAAKPGCRVTVPFGRGNKHRLGIIFNVCDASSIENKKSIKKIAAVLDEASLINSEQLELAKWLKHRTFCTLFEAVKVLLPSGINHKMQISYSAIPLKDSEDINKLSDEEREMYEYLLKRGVFVKRSRILSLLGYESSSDLPEQLVKKGLFQRNYDAVRNIGDLTVKMVRLSPSIGSEFERMPKLTKKQNTVVELLKDIGSASIKEVCYFTGLTPSVPASLEKKGVVEFFENEVYRSPYDYSQTTPDRSKIELTKKQKEVFNRLKEQYKNDGGASLLFGVTGSGKTLIYTRLIDEVIDNGESVILMVPEISLTPQALKLFRKRYGKEVAVFHSALSVGERLDEWKRVKRGESKIVIGTRSAVFAPFEKIGLIIIDEEQEHTYKSESSPRYNARDVARFRCAKHNALLLLSSATPSLESFAAAKKGRYSLNILDERYGNASLPKVITVDMCDERRNGNTSSLSTELVNQLQANLEVGHQSILLINRRGYNTFVSCRDCRHVITCPSCSISLTYHHSNERLMCHYCGYSAPFTSTCPLCASDAVRYAGFGTQKIEEELSELVPQARVLRLDTDTTMSKFSHEIKLEKFADKQYDIMLGTQMVAKGLDFENVTLVGVVSVDQQLYNDDYKSLERTFNLLTQVVGRAGRGKFEGKAIIQTLTPENDIIHLAKKQDYEAFFDSEIKIRKMLIYPPYCDICVIGLISTEELFSRAGSKRVLEIIQNLSKEKYSDQKMIVLGPMPARVMKVSNKYRYRLIIKCHNTSKFREMIAEVLCEMGKDSKYNKVSVYADMNPENIL